MSRHFAVLDAGWHDITAVAARWNKNGDYALEGFCRLGSAGFREGVVTDVVKATDSIAGVLDKLGERTGKKPRDIYAGINSSSISVVPSSGALLLSRYGREISEKDIKKCMKVASIIKTPLDKEALHRIVYGFSVDGEKGIKNPLSLEGVKLEVNMNILTINSTVLRNVEKCVSQAGFVPAGFVFSGLAVAHRVLTDDRKDEGVALLNIRGGLTDAVIFCGGALVNCKVFRLGANDLTLPDGTVNTDKLKDLADGVTALYGWNNVRTVAVAGEGALADNLIELLEELLKLPATAGNCIARPFEDLPPERAMYAGCLGMLDHLQEERRRRYPGGNFFKRGLEKVTSFLDSYF